MTPAYSTYSASGDARFSAHSQDDATHNHPLSADRSPWAESSFARPPPPEYLGSFTLPAPPLHVLPSNLHNRPLSAFGERPKSSPSTFGPTAHTVNWPDPREFKPSTYSHYPEPPMLHSSFQPSVPFQPVLGTELGSPSPPPHLTMHHPQPSRRYAALAPSPGKRSHDDETMGYNSEDAGAPASAATNKRRKRTCSVASADLSEDDKLLVSLKEDEALPWKDIAARFGEHHGKTFQVAALQMRYKRLREKFRVWQSEDVEALKLASEYYEKYKWDIISSKVSLGLSIPSRHVLTMSDARLWCPRTMAFEALCSQVAEDQPHAALATIDRHTTTTSQQPPAATATQPRSVSGVCIHACSDNLKVMSTDKCGGWPPI